ncbi:MAG: potassium channel protein [Nodosilinea sp. WJT8-NPBG4]|nr:potassium channel protein [Nodosilinea sp. WJT8-NPBG4]
MRLNRSRYGETIVEENYRRTQQHLIRGAIALGCVMVAGVFWYHFVEGWSWLDSVYMAVITLSTVGFGETNPLSPRGRLFTILLIMTGVGVIAYILNNLTEAIVQGHFQAGFRSLKRRRFMESMQGHYIICGLGRTGRQVATEFLAENIPFVVVDSDDGAVRRAQQLGYVTLQGDATQDQTLLQAGVERARCLVAALPSDAENLYIVLSAKTLAPGIRTIARASSEEAILKLQRGGADVVVSPYITGGKRMAAAALRPQVVDFLDGMLTGAERAVYVEEFLLLPESCPIIGKTLAEAQLGRQSGALILAIRRDGGVLIFAPSADTRLYPGDMVISMGNADQLRLLSQIISPIAR